MRNRAVRVLLVGATLAAWSTVARPAAAQDTAVADSLLLLPSWSESIAAAGLAPGRTPLALRPSPERPRPREICLAAGVAGASAGLLAEALGAGPVDWPPGFDYFPARSWRSLPGLGEALAVALVCPPPLTTDPVLPPRPES